MENIKQITIHINFLETGSCFYISASNSSLNIQPSSISLLSSAAFIFHLYSKNTSYASSSICLTNSIDLLVSGKDLQVVKPHKYIENRVEKKSFNFCPSQCTVRMGLVYGATFILLTNYLGSSLRV